MPDTYLVAGETRLGRKNRGRDEKFIARAWQWDSLLSSSTYEEGGSFLGEGKPPAGISKLLFLLFIFFKSILLLLLQKRFAFRCLLLFLLQASDVGGAILRTSLGHGFAASLAIRSGFPFEPILLGLGDNFLGSLRTLGFKNLELVFERYEMLGNDFLRALEGLAAREFLEFESVRFELLFLHGPPGVHLRADLIYDLPFEAHTRSSYFGVFLDELAQGGISVWILRLFFAGLSGYMIDVNLLEFYRFLPGIACFEESDELFNSRLKIRKV